MLKVMLATVAAATVVLTPAVAHGATHAAKVRGTVAVKQANRHVLVIASRHGVVESARVTARQLRRTRVGERLALVGRRLADGSLRVTKLRNLGSAKRARLSVVVLKAMARRVLVAGGGSAFSIRLTRGTRLLASRRSMRSGEKLEADVDISRNGMVGRTLDDNGDAAVIDFSGVVTAIGATSFTVSADGIATVVQLPDGVALPAIVQVGSEVEIVAAITGSTLTLKAIKLDGEDEQEIEAEGTVTALDTTAGTITIQTNGDEGGHSSDDGGGGGGSATFTFAIPTGFTLPDGLAVGSSVEARGDVVNGVLTLTRIQLEDDGGDG